MHGGGYLGGYSGRIDHAWGARTDVANKLPKPPTEYLKKVYFDTVVFTPHQLEYLVKVFGADHILMGTDYPFDMADYDPVGHVVEYGSRSTRRPSRRSAAGMRRSCWVCRAKQRSVLRRPSSDFGLALRPRLDPRYCFRSKLRELIIAYIDIAGVFSVDFLGAPLWNCSFAADSDLAGCIRRAGTRRQLFGCALKAEFAEIRWLTRNEFAQVTAP